MVETWTCNRCLVMHRIDPERIKTARKANKVFRCEKEFCDILYTDRAQPTRNKTPQCVRLYIEQAPAYV